MEIKEKTIIRHSFHFTQEDLELIVSIIRDVWSFADVNLLITEYDMGFGTILGMLRRIRESVMNRNDLTCEDDKYLDALTDLLCTFEVRYENDQRLDAAREIRRTIAKIRRPGGDY